jgi:hypothetical protein
MAGVVRGVVRDVLSITAKSMPATADPFSFVLSYAQGVWHPNRPDPANLLDLRSERNMARYRWLVLATLLIFGKGTGPAASAQGPLKCSNLEVRYSPFDATYSNRIVLKSVTTAENPPQSAAKQYSPQHTMWLAKVDADTMKPGPWTTSVYFGSDGNGEVWKLSLVDHASGGVSVEWLSEKLVFGRVWWGRIVSTDFVLDVQKHQFIYREMAEYGDLIQPCK